MRDGRFSPADGLEWLVRDRHGRRGVLGHVPVRGHDGDDGVTHVPDLVAREHGLPARAQVLVVDHGGNLAQSTGRREVRRPEDSDHPRQGKRGGGVHAEARMRVNAANERHVVDTGQAQVVEKRRFAPEEPMIFQALEGLSDEPGRHVTRAPPCR